MASEVAELTSIRDEDLLRRMWQQSEDFGRKKEIRAHMYKLREERLRNFYTGDMDSGIGMSKSPMTPSHGDSLVDQSFQSFKTKEIRDSESPTREFKYGITPDTSGWNVVTASEVSTDGKTQINSSLATTAGVQDVIGGKTSFAGKNEQLNKHTFDGDENNFRTSTSHSSNTHLNEHQVTGDPSTAVTESRSSTTMSSSSEFVSSTKSSDRNTETDRSTKSVSPSSAERHLYDESNHLHPEMSLPTGGQLVSRTIEYPDAKTKLTTEVKSLPDGTVVTSRRYETKGADTTQHGWTSSSKSATTSTAQSTHDNSNSIRNISTDFATVEAKQSKPKQDHFTTERVVGERSTRRNQQNEEFIRRERDEHERYNIEQQLNANDALHLETRSEAVHTNKTTKTVPIAQRQEEDDVDRAHRIQHEIGHDGEMKRTVKKDLRQQTDEFLRRDDQRTEIHIGVQPHQRTALKSDRITVPNDPSHDVFARSLRSDTSSNDRATNSMQSSATSVRSGNSGTHHLAAPDHQRRSPSRDTTYSDNSRISSSTVIKTPARSSVSRSPEKYAERKDSHQNVITSVLRSTFSSETIDMTTDDKRKATHRSNQTPNKLPEHSAVTNGGPRQDNATSPVGLEKTQSNKPSRPIVRDASDQPKLDLIRPTKSMMPKHDSDFPTDEVEPHYMRPTISSTTPLGSAEPSQLEQTDDSPRFSKIRESSTPNDDPEPHYMRPTISSSTALGTAGPQHPEQHDDAIRRSSNVRESTAPSEDPEPHCMRPTKASITLMSSGTRAAEPNERLSKSSKIRESSVPSDEPEPHYMRPTISSSTPLGSADPQHHQAVDQDDGPRSSKIRDSSVPNDEYEPHFLRPTISSATPLGLSKPRHPAKHEDHPQRSTENFEFETGETTMTTSLTSSVSDIEYVSMLHNKHVDSDSNEIVIKTQRVNDVDQHDGHVYSVQPTPVEPQPETVRNAEPQTVTVSSVKPSDDECQNPKEFTKLAKERPPFTRSETYEERCRLMLGMKTSTTTVPDIGSDTVDFIQTERINAIGVDVIEVTVEQVKPVDRKRSKQNEVVPSPATSPVRRIQHTTEVSIGVEVTPKSHETSSPDRKSLAKPNHSKPNRTAEPTASSPDSSLQRTTSSSVKHFQETNVRSTTENITRTTAGRNSIKDLPKNRRSRSPESDSETNLKRHSPVVKKTPTHTSTSARLTKTSKTNVELKLSASSPESSPERKPNVASTHKPKQRRPSTPAASPDRRCSESASKSRTTQKSINDLEIVSKPNASLPDSSPERKTNATTSTHRRPSTPVASPDCQPNDLSVKSKIMQKVDVEIVRKPNVSSLESSPERKLNSNKSTQRRPCTPAASLERRPSTTEQRCPSVKQSKPSKLDNPESPTACVEVTVHNIKETKLPKTNKTQPDCITEPQSKTKKSSFTTLDRTNSKTTIKPALVSPTKTNDGVQQRTTTSTANESNKTTRTIDLNRSMKKLHDNHKNSTELSLKPSKSPSEKHASTRKIVSDSIEEIEVKNERSAVHETTTETLARVARKSAITERKDSAPVYSTKKDKEPFKMTRSSTSDGVLRLNQSPQLPQSTRNRPETVAATVKPKSDNHTKRPNKCVTTKTINLSTTSAVNTMVRTEDNIIIDIQQAKSSREPTPNRIVPTPASPEDDTGKPRYPDTVVEPEEDATSKRKPYIKNIPIFEEDVNEFISCQITEVDNDERASLLGSDIETDHSENDDCMLSVSDKVSKFSSVSDTPKRTIERKSITEIDETVSSVNEKINKFIITAEKKNNPRATKPVHIDLDNLDDSLVNDDCLLSVTDKVNKLTSTAKRISGSIPQKSPELVAKIERQVSRRDEAPRCDEEQRLPATTSSTSIRPSKYVPVEYSPTALPSEDDTVPSAPIMQRNDSVRRTVADRYVPNKEKTPTKSSDGSLPSTAVAVASNDIMLRSTEAIRKARSVFESIDAAASQPKQRDILSRPSVWEDRRTKEKHEKDVKLTDIGVYKRTPDETAAEPYERPVRPSLSPDRISDGERRSANRELFETHATIKARMDAEKGEQSVETTNIIRLLNSRTPSRNFDDERETPPEQHSHQTNDQHISRDSDKPSYMNHTVCSLEHIRREQQSSNRSKKTSRDENISPHNQEPDDSSPNGNSKFGVELKHLNSQTTSPSTGGRRKSSSSEIPHIEDVFELELLEKMLETVIGYEQRRRIRSQIRIVKKQQPPAVVETTPLGRKSYHTTIQDYRNVQNSLRESASPVRKSTARPAEVNAKVSPVRHTTAPKYQATHQPSPISMDDDQEDYSEECEDHIARISESKSMQKPGAASVPKSSTVDVNVSTSQSNRTNTTAKHHTFTTANAVTNRTRQTSLSPSPKAISARETPVTKPTRPQQTTSKPPKVNEPESKPIWATQNILKKASETSTRTFKPTSASAAKKSVTKVQKQNTIDNSEDDCVTSSYGIGPTDEDGMPLFGIRALKKKSQQQAVQPTTKVTGTIVEETLHSKNNAPPSGSRTVTHYSSTDEPTRIETTTTTRSQRNADSKPTRSITSVTSVYRIGGVEQPIADDAQQDIVSNSETKVLRGSVKEMSDKFIRKKSLTSAADKSAVSATSYPKAGLILRTQCSRESTPVDGVASSVRSDSIDFDECDMELRISQKSATRSTFVDSSDNDGEEQSIENRETKQISQKQTRTFLNSSGAKVTGFQDILDRMRNSDSVKEVGDTAEDQEARALLNKFLGATVLMSGMESMVAKEASKIVGVPSAVQSKQRTKQTQQQQVSSSQVITSSYTTSLSSSTAASDLNDIWDIELLKRLLENSSAYEERRSIRARIRQVMAEKEAADIVASVTTDDAKKPNLKEKIVQPAKKADIVVQSSGEEEDEEEVEESECEEEQTEEEEEEEDDVKVVEEKKKKTIAVAPVEKKAIENQVAATPKAETTVKSSASATITSALSSSTASETVTTITTVAKTKEKVAPPTAAKAEEKLASPAAVVAAFAQESIKAETAGDVTVTNMQKGVTKTTSTKVVAPVSPFAKFRQLDKQSSTSSHSSASSPSTPKTPGGGSALLFKFTDPVLNARAATVKDILLQWCQSKTKEYENIQITNFSTAWSDGLAFCALIHHFLPDSFDYSVLTAKQRRHNFTLAFRVADEKAGIAPLLDVEDMVIMKKPDWKCVFTYVQSIHRRFKNVD